MLARERRCDLEMGSRNRNYHFGAAVSKTNRSAWGQEPARFCAVTLRLVETTQPRSGTK